MHRGRIVESGPALEILQHPPAPSQRLCPPRPLPGLGAHRGPTRAAFGHRGELTGSAVRPPAGRHHPRRTPHQGIRCGAKEGPRHLPGRRHAFERKPRHDSCRRRVWLRQVHGREHGAVVFLLSTEGKVISDGEDNSQRAKANSSRRFAASSRVPETPTVRWIPCSRSTDRSRSR